MGKIEFNWDKFRRDIKAFGYRWRTQKTKARQMCISQSKLSRLETGSGSVSISVEDLANICSAMEKTPGEYFGYEEN